MGCCSPFSAATTRPTADPARHVNFTTGMVLGVDDYHQEFAYHSARDKWIVRDFLGYGTLSGLAVTLEDDGANGPRVRVTAGSAAAPSGQLICVGRDQCGSLNPWLARPEVVEKLRTLTEGSATPDAATLNLFLTLCYVDCAVADVPIPGEPCRSDENLMAPSRIADDYCLDFCFEPPPMAEAQAIATLDAFWATLDIAPGNTNTPAAFANAVRRAELQLRLTLGIADPEAPAPPAADLNPIALATAVANRFGDALMRLWVTRLRPLVAAQRCGAEAVPANDCVLLARLTVPVVKVATHWEVDGVAPDFSVGLDESERPLLVSVATAQSAAGIAMAGDGRGQTIVFMSAPGNIPAGPGLVIVQADADLAIKVPAATAPSLARSITVKAAGDHVVTLTTPASTTIDGANALALAVRGAASLVSDGAGTWHVTGMVH